MPAARYMPASATVPLARATPWRVPCRSAMSSSKRRVAGPLVKIPDARTAPMASSSSGPVIGEAIRILGSGRGAEPPPTEASGS